MLKLSWNIWYSVDLIKHMFCIIDYFLSYLLLQLHNTSTCNKAFYIWCRRKWKIHWILLPGFVVPNYWKCAPQKSFWYAAWHDWGARKQNKSTFRCIQSSEEKWYYTFIWWGAYSKWWYRYVLSILFPEFSYLLYKQPLRSLSLLIRCYVM